MQPRSQTAGAASSATSSYAPILSPERGYYTGTATKTARQGTDELFHIESVVCGDGHSAKSGLTLRNMVIYASDRLDGGVESYYQVDPHSLKFTIRGGKRAGNWHTRALTERSKANEMTNVPLVQIPSTRREQHGWIQEELRVSALRWLCANRGCALSVGGPSGRGSISEVQQFLVFDFGSVFDKQNGGNCITAAITNAVALVRGLEMGRTIREYFFEESPHYLKIREGTLVLLQLGTGAEMRKIPKADLDEFNSNRFAYLASRTSGVYVVHLYQRKVVSHAVVVDGNRKLIIDSAEDFPLRLNEEVLRMCGGDMATALRVGEIRLVVRQRLPCN